VPTIAPGSELVVKAIGVGVAVGVGVGDGLGVGVGVGVGDGVWFTPVPLRVTAGTAVAEFVLKDNVPEYGLTAVGENVRL
jgi:hypothetical protein